VVSLNPCLDAILMEVADPSQIAALSHYSRLPSQSAVADKARRFPFTWGSGEEILALKPDLVLSSGMGGAQLAHVLPRLHILQASFTVPNSVADSQGQVTRVAALVGHPERGAALNARIRAALTASSPGVGERRFGALIYEGHGIASGPHTLMSELMADAGFDNLAPRYGAKHTLDIPLESVLAHPPEVMLSGRLGPNEPSWADRILSHPALSALAPHTLRETFPEQLMFCGGPVIVPAVEALAEARKNAEKGVSR
jgi:iron complex transport system substrate-binding protein